MPKLYDPEIEGRIQQLLDERFSYRRIREKLLESGIRVSLHYIQNVKKGEGERRKAKRGGCHFVQKRKRTTRTPEMIKRVVRAFSVENPPYQRDFCAKKGISGRSLRRMLHEDSDFQTRKKIKTFRLSDANKMSREENGGKLLKLLKKKSEFLVTLDEANFRFIPGFGKNKVCYVKRGHQIPSEWVNDINENFPKSVMLVAAVCGRGTLFLKKVPKGTKINSENFCRSVMQPLVKVHLPKFYTKSEMKKIFVHFDAASSHTSQYTTHDLQLMSKKFGVMFIRKEDIPIKGADISPLDFWGFGYMKNEISKHKSKDLKNFYRKVREIWSAITPETVKKVYQEWMKRCESVVQKGGAHVEQVSYIHDHSSSF